MKKNLILIMSVVFMTGLLCGCSAGSGFEAKSYVSDAPVSGVFIDVRDREINVSLSEDERVHIDYFENEDESYEISISDEGILNMAANNNEGISWFFGAKSYNEQNKIMLQLPSDTLASLEIRTTNENIFADSVNVTDNIKLSDNNGDILFEKLNAGTGLQIENKNGSIRGTVAGSYDDFAIYTESKKGENNLPASKEGGTKTLNVINNNGDIDVEFAAE